MLEGAPVFALAVILGVIWLQLPLGLPGIPVEQTADSTADWVVTRAAAHGLDPYDDVRHLSDQVGGQYVFLSGRDVGDLLGSPPYVHPRTPGALFVQLPLILATPAAIHTVMGLVSAAALASVVLVAAELGRLGHRATLILVPTLFLSSAVSGAFAFGVQSVLVAAMTGLAWLQLQRRDAWIGGVLLGLATTLKLFPALLWFALISTRRWRALIASVGVTLALNLSGLLLFGLRLDQVVDGFQQATRVWLPFGANGSVSRLVAALGVPTSVAGSAAVLLVAAAYLVILRQRASFDATLATGVVLSVLGSPLSWGHYDTILLPVAAWLWGRGGPERWFAIGWFVLFLNPFGGTAPAGVVGGLLFASRLVLLAGCVRATRTGTGDHTTRAASNTRSDTV